MRIWLIAIGILAVIGLGLALYFLKPVNGPARDLTLVGDATRGAYLLVLGDCVACHTDAKAGKAPFSGGPALRTPFGSFFAPNITPDPDHGIGGWTLADFSRALSDGEGPGFMNHLYPAFPYDSYTLMSDEEIADLYAALMALEPIAEPSIAHEVGFPFNVRPILAGWKNLFFTPKRFAPDPARSKLWNRGKYLVEGPAHCVSCHTPRNALGGPDTSHPLAGSSGGPAGNVPGITSERLVAEGYDKAMLIEALTTGFTPGFDILGGAMGEVIENSTAKWTDEDLQAVAEYLLGEE
ncbi:MAG: cytochrome c [Alphaproteobacteria bacterium]|nr:cytochrome c [Alphaproteobacteria bacterium]